MLSFLLDTDICIELIRQRDQTLYRKVFSFESKTLGISSITLAELHYGAGKSSNPEKQRYWLNSFCVPLQVLAFDEQACRIYGQIRAALERQGLVIGPLDLFIAAHALTLEVPLVTRNVSEFSRVPGLRVERW